MNQANSLQKKIDSTSINRFGGYYTPGVSYSPARIAECVGKCHEIKDNVGREPSIDEFMEASKIGGRDLAIKILHNCKHGITLNTVIKGHRHVGPLSRIECFNEGVSLDLCILYLDNPDQPIRSYQFQLTQIYGVDVSDGTISQ